MSGQADDLAEAPRHRSRKRAWSIIVVAAIVLAIIGIPALMVVMTANTAKAQSEALKGAIDQATATIQAGSFTGIPAILQSIDTAATDLDETTQSWQWQVLARAPGMADTAAAVPVLATAAQQLAQAAGPFASAIESSPSTLALVERLPELRPAVQQLAVTARQATSDLGAIPTTDLKFGLADQIEKATESTATIADLAASTDESYPALTGLLGFDEPRTYLVMLQNPAEARGSGGLLSAFMLVTLDQGRPTIVEANSRKVLDDLRIPVPASLDKGEKGMWGDFLTKWPSFNVSPDFPTVAALARSGMKARGTPVDGVIAIDASTVQAILAGTGPVEHKGTTIDATTAADFFAKGLYEQFPGFDDVDAKDELALGLLYATVDSVLKRPLDLKSLADAFPTAIDEGHVRAWVPSDQEQAWLEEVGVAHDIATVDPSTSVVALNNATGGKLDAHVSATVEQQIGTCTYAQGDFAGWRQSAITVTLKNDAPEGLPAYVDVRLDDESAPKGSARTLISVYGPPGAVDEDVTANGDFADYVGSQAHGRPFWLGSLDLPRGSEQDFVITYAEPPATATTEPARVSGAFSPTSATITIVNSTSECTTATN